MVNRVILLGNVGNEPEVKMLPSGSKVANLSIATTENWKDKDGNKQSKTEWHRITVFSEGLIKIVEQYIHKGQTLYVEGSLKTTKYTDAAGIEKYSTNVMVQGYGDTIRMVGGSKSSGGESFDNDSGSTKAISNDTSADMDDEIPF
jgi:single-strand DNA-binding protein